MNRPSGAVWVKPKFSDPSFYGTRADSECKVMQPSYAWRHFEPIASFVARGGRMRGPSKAKNQISLCEYAYLAAAYLQRQQKRA